MGHAHHSTLHTWGSNRLPVVLPTPGLLPTVTHALFSGCKSLTTILPVMHLKGGRMPPGSLLWTAQLDQTVSASMLLVSPNTCDLCLLGNKCAQRKSINAMKYNSRQRVKKETQLIYGFFMWFYIPCQVGKFPLQWKPGEASQSHRRLLTKRKGALP